MATLEKPHLHHKKEVTTICEVIDIETGGVLRSTFSYIDKYDYVWFCQHPMPKTKVTIDDVNRTLELVPDETIYPLATHLTTVVENPGNNTFIKRLKLSYLDAGQKALELLQLLFFQEVELLESIKDHPHRNLVRYLGCTVNRGRITGIVLERHDRILADRFKRAASRFDNETCIEDLRAGIGHLHSLGLAHNDLHPGNIALDSDDRPVILDFGSCKKFDEPLLSAGTPGWADEYFTSEAQHDKDAIEKIKTWLEEESKRAFGI